MRVPRESWREFAARIRARELDFSSPRDRLIAIDLIYEIMDEFISPNTDLMLPVYFEHPPGGRAFSLDHWVHDIFEGDVEMAYDEAFGGTSTPSPLEVVSLLARYGLALHIADTAQELHLSWMGAEASAGVLSLLNQLRKGLDAGLDTPQREHEFVRLAALLDRALPAGPVDGLSMLWFRLSPKLGDQELDRRREGGDPYVIAMLQMDAENSRLVSK